VQLELAGLDRLAERGEGAQTVGGVAVAVGGVGLDAGALLLRDVTRDVGVLHQRGGVVAVLGEQRDADRALELEQHPLEVERLRHVVHPTDPGLEGMGEGPGGKGEAQLA